MTDSENDPKKELIQAGVELVKTTYQDALQPVAKETGKALGTLGKTVNMALSPLHALVWGWDKISDYVKETVEKKLEERKVPPEQIKTPDPDVAVPALEALRYSKLRENYANLLATSMDTKTAIEAHPAFVEILKQLTPDEAKILQHLPAKGRVEPVVDVGFKLPEKGEFVVYRNASTLGHDVGCEFPEITPKYIDNLCRLGLAEMPAGRHLIDDWRYDKIRKSVIVTEVLAGIPAESKEVINKKYIGLTDLGDSFRRACT